MDHSPAFLDLVNNIRTRVHEISIDEVRRRLHAKPDSIRFVDVREDTEWEIGHAVGAEHIGKGVIERDIEKKVPDKATELILYCGGGYRSIIAAETIQRMGYTNVFSMDGGWRGWCAARAPIQGTPATPS